MREIFCSAGNANRFVATELPDTDKEPILRSYLRRWKWEVGQFSSGVDGASSSGELR